MRKFAAQVIGGVRVFSDATETAPVAPPAGLLRAFVDRVVGGLRVFGSATGSSTVTPPTISGVTVTPSTPTVTEGTTQQFSAVASGANSPPQTFTWSISGPGTLSASGLYTAPAATNAPQAATITATSTFDATKSGSATVNVPAIAAPVQTVTSVTVSPVSVAVTALATQQFAATVTGTNFPGQAVTWSKTGGGTLSASGLFTAPGATAYEQIVTITATSVLDTGKSGSATVTIAAAASTVASVVVSPATAALAGLAQQQFTATVTGTYSPSQSVVWSKVGGGTLTSSGLFTAPAATSSVQTITITATCGVDPTKSGSAVVTVAAAVVAVPTVIGVAISPSAPSLAGLATQQFTAVVSGNMSPSQQVTWSISGAGALSASGLYAAPPAIESTQMATITATSVIDVTKSASATVTIAAAPTSVPSGPTTRAPSGGGYKKRYRTWRIRPPSIQG